MNFVALVIRICQIMSEIVIKAENLGKKYRIGHLSNRQSYTALRDVLTQTAHNLWQKTRDMVTGKPIVLGDTQEDIWALKDVSFEIRQGETVGIIGRNGAGKSTLLKILSRITEPTEGRVTIRGRVASLLEVGTGFHPELTGRENIYLNGAILGMSRAEIRQKFDEIVAFAEVDKFIDTPVKRYSSGMYVRLAFAVAAHLEPEILLVDEVLAVGDAQFQKKCLGKMGDVAQEGRTVLFVSHNMAAIQRLCPNAFLLHDGGISKFGNTSEVIPFYMSAMEKYSTKGPVKSGPAELIIYMETLNGERKYIFNIGDPIRFIILLNVDRAINRAAFGLGIIDIMGGRVITHHTMFQHADSWGVKNSTRITVEWPECILCPGSYHFVLALFESGQMIALWEDIGELIVIEADYFGTGRLPDPHVQGKVVTIAKWHIEEQLHILN
jgi:lipopolysaccharide transport system ATP-binding protein